MFTMQEVLEKDVDVASLDDIAGFPEKVESAFQDFCIDAVDCVSKRKTQSITSTVRHSWDSLKEDQKNDLRMYFSGETLPLVLLWIVKLHKIYLTTNIKGMVITQEIQKQEEKENA